MVLHTLNKSPHRSRLLEHCLSLISAPAALVLIEDGTYAATQALAGHFAELDPAIDVYVLRPDAQARGLLDRLAPRAQLIDDKTFVELSLRCSAVQAWY